MATFWERITARFTAAENSSPQHPAVHEVIGRDAQEQADYERWKRTLARKRLLDWLTQAYASFLATGQGDPAVAFLDTPSSKGFVIHLSETQYGLTEMRHFFHYLKERMTDLNYRVQVSDRRIYNRPDWVETQERHYLKPRTRKQRMNGPVARGDLDQRFGNVTVELELRDDRPWNLRLRATTYQDALYNEPESFRGLLMALAGPDEE